MSSTYAPIPQMIAFQSYSSNSQNGPTPHPRGDRGGSGAKGRDGDETAGVYTQL